MHFKIPIIAIVFVLAFGTFLIVRIATNIPDNWLMVTFSNTYADVGTGSELWKEFTEYEGYDLKQKKVEFNNASYFDYTKNQWFFFGFSAITMLTARLLVKDFSKYLPLVDDFGDFILDENGNKIMPGSPEEKAYYASAEGAESAGGHEMTEEEMIEELRKLDM